MKIKLIRIFLFIVVLPFLMLLLSRADTIYFNNGNTREGIVKREDGGLVEMDIGSGTVTFSKSIIAKIERSTPEEAKAISESWEKAQEAVRKNEGAVEAERQRRFGEYDRWTREESARQEKTIVKAGEVPIVSDPNSKGIMVKALLDGKAEATLILDTGADIVILSRKIGEALGIDLSDANQMIELHLAGDRRVKARMFVLKSLMLSYIEANDVRAGILLEDDTGLMLADGLLGMSFLNRYNFKIDLKNMKLVLEKTG